LKTPNLSLSLSLSQKEMPNKRKVDNNNNNHHHHQQQQQQQYDEMILEEMKGKVPHHMYIGGLFYWFIG
jgi:hypothetical protein